MKYCLLLVVWSTSRILRKEYSMTEYDVTGKKNNKQQYYSQRYVTTSKGIVFLQHILKGFFPVLPQQLRMSCI